MPYHRHIVVNLVALHPIMSVAHLCLSPIRIAVLVSVSIAWVSSTSVDMHASMLNIKLLQIKLL